MKVRRATLRDLAALVHHRRGMFEDMGIASSPADDRRYAAWARRRLRAGTLVAFLAESRGAIVAGGCVWLQPRQPRPGFHGRLPYLLSMYTEPAHRGRGLASRIVRAATAWCRARGYPKMTLHASVPGRRVYRRLGWTRTWEMEVRLA